MAVCLCSEIFMSLFARFSKENGRSAGLAGPHRRRTCGYSAHWESINCHILPYFDSISRKTLHATSLVFIAAANMAVNPQTNSQQNSTTITFSLIRSEGLAFKTFHEFEPITSKSWIINLKRCLLLSMAAMQYWSGLASGFMMYRESRNAWHTSGAGYNITTVQTILTTLNIANLIMLTTWYTYILWPSTMSKLVVNNTFKFINERLWSWPRGKKRWLAPLRLSKASVYSASIFKREKLHLM